ncbi:MAG TPA: hypothetical protein VHP31_05975, partial [Caproicibacter sp.]|nr:hypothetical protein [Caproicibacter sp.]
WSTNTATDTATFPSAITKPYTSTNSSSDTTAITKSSTNTTAVTGTNTRSHSRSDAFDLFC